MQSDQVNTVLPSTIALPFRVIKIKREQLIAYIFHSSPSSPTIKKEANNKLGFQAAI